MSELTRCSVCGSIFKSDLPVSVAVCQNCRAIDPYKVEVAESFRNLAHKVSVLESKMREVLPEYSPAPPQPAPVPNLVEAVEALLKEIPYKIDGCCSFALNEAINNFHRALATEKRRQELVDRLLVSLRKYRASDSCWEAVEDAIDNLDAFDKERGV